MRLQIRCIDYAVLRYGLLIKVKAMRLSAWPYGNIRQEQMYQYVLNIVKQRLCGIVMGIPLLSEEM